MDEGKQFDKPEETEVMAMSAEEEAPVSLEESVPSISEILADGTVTCKPGKDTSILETEQDLEESRPATLTSYKSLEDEIPGPEVIPSEVFGQALEADEKTIGIEAVPELTEPDKLDQRILLDDGDVISKPADWPAFRYLWCGRIG